MNQPVQEDKEWKSLTEEYFPLELDLLHKVLIFGELKFFS